MSAIVTAMEGGLENTYDFKEDVAKIENLEQNIIQHIRTSGVRKPRETALIDEVMELRRERRKFSTTIYGHLKALDKQNSALQQEMDALRHRLQTSTAGEEQLQRKQAEMRETERQQFEERLKNELATQEEKLEFMEKINIAKVRNKYEERMKELELKMKDVFQERAKTELKDARTIAMELVEKAKVELERRCNEKIAE